MRTLTLSRMAETPAYTLGRVEDAELRQVCVTLEEPWRDANGDGIGDRNVSRIPAGTYPCFRRLSPARGYEVFELRDVPGRHNVQIHKGNSVADTLGCILVGTNFGKNGTITESKKAFETLMRDLEGVEEFTLHVRDAAAVSP